MSDQDKPQIRLLISTSYGFALPDGLEFGDKGFVHLPIKDGVREVIIDRKITRLLTPAHWAALECVVRVAHTSDMLDSLTFGWLKSDHQEAIMAFIDKTVAAAIGVGNYRSFLDKMVRVNMTNNKPGIFGKFFYNISLRKNWVMRYRYLRTL